MNACRIKFHYRRRRYFTPEDALKKFEAGAKLIQLYSGLIYEGPGILNEIIRLLPKQ